MHLGQSGHSKHKHTNNGDWETSGNEVLGKSLNAVKKHDDMSLSMIWRSSPVNALKRPTDDLADEHASS